MANGRLTRTIKNQYPQLTADTTGRISNAIGAVIQYKSIIVDMAEKYSIPAEMIAAVIIKEQVTQSAPDTLLFAHTSRTGSGHSFGLGAIFPSTAYEAWQYLVQHSVTPTAEEDYKNQISDVFLQKGKSISNIKDRNIIIGEKLITDVSFSIETIAVVLQYNYARFKENYGQYEKGYFVLFECTGKDVNRKSNEWLVDNIYAGFTEEIYGHVLSAQTISHGQIGVVLRNIIRL